MYRDRKSWLAPAGRLQTVFGIVLSMPLICGPLLAAESDQGAEPGAGLAEVIVTAEKREESLQNTPISIAAFTSEELETRRVGSIADLGTVVPNLQVSPHPNTGATVRAMIRGIGEPSADQTRDPPVAIYVDGVYVSRGQGLASQLAELERVEVLRGPQGSLYGRNATAGAINFITKAPELGKFGGQQSFTFGRFNQFMSRTSLNIPVGDTLAFDLAYASITKDGFVANTGPGAARFGDIDRKGVRGAVLWKPNGIFEGRYTFDSTWLYDTSPFVAVAGIYPATGTRPDSGSSGTAPLRPGSSRVQGHNLTLSYDVREHMTLRSVTGYREVQDNTHQAYNPGPARVYLPLYNNSITDQRQFSEELQLIGEALDGGLKYVGGLYYFTESGDAVKETIQMGTINPRIPDWKNKAYAIFGQTTWTPKVLDQRLHVTVGARWSKDEREASIFERSIRPVGPPVVTIDSSGSQSFDNFSPSGSVQFDLSQDVNVFARIARGYKTGGYNPSASSSAAFARGFGPETLTSYEAGFRSELLGRRLRVNATAFYSDYKDIQTNVFDPLNTRIFDIINAGKAETSGVELEVTALVFEGFILSGGYGYTNPKFKEVRDLGGNDVTSGFRFTHAPKNSFTVAADYKSHETPAGVVEANVNYGWQDKFFGVATDKRLIAPSYGLLNARLGLADVAGIKGLRVAVWGQNLTDETYYLNHFAFGDVPVAMYGEPRAYGVDISLKF
ncbi:MAG: TonB-dependent receptor [Gammaproteobacteria bacterium]|nr:TonB-dependent receptor [Gammaproteobacteria bacterium]